MVSQTDIPAFGIVEAERVPRALADQYAGTPATPLDLARALNVQPGSSGFRMVVGASAAYGMTDGGAWADKISLTDVGRRIVRPTVEGDDVIARREAFLRPRITREFLTKYNGGKVPREDIAQNVLESLNVPASSAKRIFDQILGDARLLGWLTSINGVDYVQLTSAVSASPLSRPGEVESEVRTAEQDPATSGPAPSPEPPSGPGSVLAAPPASPNARRMYITHGSNKAFVELLKQLLKIGELEAIVSEQRETAAVPIPEKVIGDMRRCGSAIIHVDAEKTVTDVAGLEHVILNENVLIEIGAAMALYDKRFILLVREGVTLPSNLQGLYQLRYAGETLDAATALKLLEAITDIKNRPLP